MSQEKVSRPSSPYLLCLQLFLSARSLVLRFSETHRLLMFLCFNPSASCWEYFVAKVYILEYRADYL
jgi:hypothetical protein